MSRWVDADALIEKKWQAESEACFYALEDVVSVTDIEDAPSIDIVRCKECKHQWREHKVCAHEANVVDGVCGKRAEDDDFCSYGERRER